MLFLSASQTAHADQGFQISHYVVDPHEQVARRDLAEAANDWWQWAFSMPTADSQVKDTTGAKYAVIQTGDIRYLAGGMAPQKTRAATPFRLENT